MLGLERAARCWRKRYDADGDADDDFGGDGDADDAGGGDDGGDELFRSRLVSAVSCGEIWGVGWGDGGHVRLSASLTAATTHQKQQH